MSKMIQYTKGFFQYFDMFPATQFLRYKQSGDFRTVTGGCTSVGIIILFAVLFYNQGLMTINRQIIESIVMYQMEVQPQPIKVMFSKGSEFMVSVAIQNIDLNDLTKKYFNITLRQNYFGPLYSGTNFTSVPLVACSSDHFSYNQNILDYYNKFGLSKALCPPLDFQFTIGGSIVSDLASEFTVYIEHCNQVVDPTCATDAQVQALQNQYGGFTLFVPNTNTVVNPDHQEYKQVYLEEKDFYFFTTTQGLWLNGQIQQYQISTDNSIFPLTDIQTQTILTIPNMLNMKPLPVYNGLYAQIIFSKSGKSATFTRSFGKIDDFFSYVGGVIGSILMFFFFLNSYSQASYILNLASQIYTIQEGTNKNPKEFNFFYYIVTNIKQILSSLRIELQWQQPNKFITIIQQMDKQINISYLIRRINFLDQAVTSILNEHQIEALYLNERKSINVAALMRKKSSVSKGVLHTGAKDQIMTNLSIGMENTRNYLQPNDSINKDSLNTLEDQRRQVNLQKVSELNLTESWGSSEKSQKQEIKNKLKQSLTHVIRESNEGNQISRRIINKMTKKIFSQTEMRQNERNLNKQKGKNQQSFLTNNGLKNHYNNTVRILQNMQFQDLN